MISERIGLDALVRMVYMAENDCRIKVRDANFSLVDAGILSIATIGLESGMRSVNGGVIIASGR
jgi:hypothetical protein